MKNGDLHENGLKSNGVDTEKVSLPPSIGLSEEVNPKPAPPVKVSIRKLWSFASGWDLVLICIGFCVSVLTGIGYPFMSTITGDTSGNFIKLQLAFNHPNATDYNLHQFHDDTINSCIRFSILGACIFSAAFIQVMCFLTSGENMIHKMRKAFVEALMRQDIAWFDKNPSGALSTKLFDNLERVKEGTGDKVGLLIQFTSQFFAGFIIAFTYDWKLTLIMMSLSPFLVISGAMMGRMMAKYAREEGKVYGKAGSIAEEALTSIRTVIAFNGQEHECERYYKALEEGKKVGILKNVWVGVGMGTTFGLMFCNYALAFYVGTNFVADGDIEPKTLLTVFFSIMMGSMALGQASQQFAVVGTAQGAAADIFEVIDRVPKIDSYSKDGLKPSNVRGHITVNKLNFSYPTRKDTQILKGISFEAYPGQTVALVGSSGCGKSTIVQLLLRFYDPDSGSLTIDGHEVSELNIEYLRKLIGVVSQEPILFDCSIEDNIKYGNPDINHAQMVAACRMANAENFISQLPQAYKTIVGERGTQLSGGQKQRIAIARALVRDPKILLLDEATSALDAESESVVQHALDKARQGRTTIVIAHRLTTIKNADRIIAMKDGEVVETGVHDELMEKKGLYYKLVNAQVFADVEDPNQRKSISYGRQESHISQRTRTSSHTSNQKRMSVINPEDESDDEENGIKSHMTPKAEKLVKRLKKDLKKEGAKEASLINIIKYARPEWKFLIIAFISSALQGVVFPAFSLFLTQIFEIFSGADKAEMKRQGHIWSLLFVGLAFIQFITLFIEASLFGYAAEKLTLRLRTNLFRNVMSMDISYFDMPNHSSGKISTRLATDTPNVKSAIDFRLGSVISAFISVFCGVGIAFYFGWQMALLLLAIFPLTSVGQALRMKYLHGNHKRSNKDFEMAGKLALEAAENIRTVQSLTLERKFHQMFCHHLDITHKSAFNKSLMQGVTYGFAVSIMQFLFASAFRFGLFLLEQNQIHEPIHVLRVLMALQFSAASLGFAAAYFPEYAKARLAAGIIFKMLGEKPKIDSFMTGGKRTNIRGSVKLKEVQFSYPQRATTPILRGLDLHVEPGQTLALVGPSGCGKSTVVSLLERFYDPANGQVLIDGEDLREMNVSHVRAHMALVSQEPILFDCSIKENIVYGLDASKIPMESIEHVCKLANIHKFITTLTNGYETRVGEKGTQLSGGQKQRIAIARALIRDPKILLLDEATSALDMESEKVVQEALDRASEGRTCIVIAHRLATIINADCIAVVKNGVIIEKGTCEELLQMKGAFFALYQKQNMKKE